MTKKVIKLAPFKTGTIFTGRPQGVATRETLKLDQLDKDDNAQVCFEIPEDTTSLNPSFYLGLLYPSYKTLGVERFQAKYQFQITTTDDATRKVLQDNLADGERNAQNALEGIIGF